MVKLITCFLFLLNINSIQCFLFLNGIKREFFKDIKLEKERKQQIERMEQLDREKNENIKYNLNWYVIEESKNIQKDKLNKITLLNKNYVIWKDENNFYALDDECSHRGAPLSNGYLKNNCAVCPYHAAEFNDHGILCKMPGQTSQINYSSSSFHQNSYPIVERNGWVYLNIINKKIIESTIKNDDMDLDNNSLNETMNETMNEKYFHIFQEPEVTNDNFSVIHLNSKIKANNRLVSENLLDVMHIAYVHTFGNKENPLPINEPMPFLLRDYPYHYKITYQYKSGKKSAAKSIFKINDLIIENEFVLPHTVISRVYFGTNVKTIVTFASPLNEKETRLFIKIHRNYWRSSEGHIFADIYNHLGDKAMIKVLKMTIDEDIQILESIAPTYVDGKFNMKYDKFPYMYRKVYESLKKL